MPTSLPRGEKDMGRKRKRTAGISRKRKRAAGIAIPKRSKPRRINAEKDKSSSAFSAGPGGQIESDAESRRQRALDEYFLAWLRWRQAIDKAASGDTSAIIKLLHLGRPIPPEAQLLLADLLERHQLKKKRGAQRRPIYESSPEESKLLKAAHFVREAQCGGATFDDALMQLLPNATLTRRNSLISCEERAAAEAAGSGRECRDLRPASLSLIRCYLFRAQRCSARRRRSGRPCWVSRHAA
jgi:hypothetical protein